MALLKEEGYILSLTINSPAYYTSIHGIDDEVYKMCHNISCSINVSKYTNAFDCIGITPIIAPLEELNKGKWKEQKKILVGSKLAIISLHIDYDDYCNASISEKQNLILRNVFDSLFVISERNKGDFHYKEMIEDILKAVDR